MGYGDYTPSSSGYTKPLTKKQLREAQEAYVKADEITAHVKTLEEKEGKDAEKELRRLMEI